MWLNGLNGDKHWSMIIAVIDLRRGLAIGMFVIL